MRAQYEYYLDDKNNRVVCGAGPKYTVQFQFKIPAMMKPSVWSRFGYSRADVIQTNTEHNGVYTFALRLLLDFHGVDFSQWFKCVRPEESSIKQFAFLSKRQNLNPLLPKEGATCLCTARNDHSPVLPLVDPWLGPDLVLPREEPHIDNLVTCYPVMYKGKVFVPVEYDQENDLYYLVRVTRKSPGTVVPINLPVLVRINGEIQRLHQEAFFTRLPVLKKKRRTTNGLRAPTEEKAKFSGSGNGTQTTAAQALE